jgi:ABC-type antimicrobial peptide transport system permease subunit
VLRLVAGQGARMAAGGVALGLIAALPLGRLLRSLLYEVSPTDPLVFFGASALTLGGVSLLACYLPARRAARIDPIEALRYQ